MKINLAEELEKYELAAARAAAAGEPQPAPHARLKAVIAAAPNRRARRTVLARMRKAQRKAKRKARRLL